MDIYIKCANCGFFLLGMKNDSPVPKRVDAYPDCGSTEFEFTEYGTGF